MDFKINIFYLTSILFCIAEGRLFRFDYTYYPDIDGWLKLHLIPATWHDAWLTCDLEGSVLASPTDAELILAINYHWKSQNFTQCTFYIGVHSRFSKGHFFSIEGVSLNRIPVRWATGEPDNADNNEDCVVYTDGAVADVNCSELFPYMCFKKRTNDTVQTSCGTVDKEYELYPSTNHCYKFHRHGRTWSQAHRACAAEGGYLVVINSQDEAQYLKKLFEKNYAKVFPSSNRELIHIGMHDWDDPGVWRTIHGVKIEEAGYAEWGPSQPDNTNKIPGQHCGAMFRNAKLDDFTCDSLAPFVCEKTLDSLHG